VGYLAKQGAAVSGRIKVVELSTSRRNLHLS
jgi:hypothetical protein